MAPLPRAVTLLGIKSVTEYVIAGFLPRAKDYAIYVHIPKAKITSKIMMTNSITISPSDAKVTQFGCKHLLQYRIMRPATLPQKLNRQLKGIHSRDSSHQMMIKRNLSMKRDSKFPWEDVIRFGQPSIPKTLLHWQSSLLNMAKSMLKGFIRPTKDCMLKFLVCLRDSVFAFVRLLRRGFEAKLVDICFTYFIILVIAIALYIVDLLTGKLGIFVDLGEDFDPDEFLSPGKSVSRYVLFKLIVKSLKELQKSNKILEEWRADSQSSIDDLNRGEQDLLKIIADLKAHSFGEDESRKEIKAHFAKIEDELSNLKEAYSEVLAKHKEMEAKHKEMEAALDKPKPESD